MATVTTTDTITIPLSEYEQLHAVAASVAQLQRDNQKLSDELALLIKRLFGRSSERLDPAQMALFANALAPAAQPIETPVVKTAATVNKRGHGRPHFPDSLPRELIELDLAEDQRSCSDCGAAMECFGEEVTERGHIVPARILVKRYVRKKYACPAGHGVKTPALPGSLVDKAKYEPSVYSHLAVAKYGDHLPLHRLEGIYKRHGFKLPKSTMWELLSRLDEVVAQPILAQMRTELLQGSHMQADETPVSVRLEDGKGSRNGYIWVYRWQRRVLFDFTMTRARDGPKRFLGEWRGTLQIDGYSGYAEVARTNQLVRVGCWSHARRKLLEAVERGTTAAVPLLRTINRSSGSSGRCACVARHESSTMLRSWNFVRSCELGSASACSQRSTLKSTAFGPSARRCPRARSARPSPTSTTSGRRSQPVSPILNSRSTTTTPNAPCATSSPVARTGCSSAARRAARSERDCSP